MTADFERPLGPVGIDQSYSAARLIAQNTA